MGVVIGFTWLLVIATANTANLGLMHRRKQRQVLSLLTRLRQLCCSTTLLPEKLLSELANGTGGAHVENAWQLPSWVATSVTYMQLLIPVLWAYRRY